jgi:ATP-binding cassette subfamily C protein CydD
MNLDRRLLKQVSMVRTALGLAVLAGLFVGLATVLQARQVSQIIAGVFLGGLSLAEVMPWMGTLLVVIAARALFGYIADRAAVRAALRVKEQLREAFTRRLLDLGPAFTQGERSGELINTATQGIEALDAYFSQFLPQLALAGLLPLAYLAIVFPLDPLSGLVLLLTGPLIPFFMFLIGSAAARLTQRQWSALGRMSAYFLDTIQGLVTLKTLGRSRDQASRIAEVGEQYRLATMNVLRVTFLSALVLELLSTLGTAIIAVEIGLRLLYGRLDFEAAFFLLLLAPEFYLPLRSLGLRFHASMAGVNAARRIFEVLEQPLLTPAAPAQRSQPVPSLRHPFEIAFRDVRFTYPGRSQPALDGVSLTIVSGQTLALVGASGSGKSTLAQLLLCFLRPDSGTLLVNGIPISALPVEAWRAQVAWVPQQPAIFHGSIADNLRMARPNASVEDLRRAAGQAHLLEFIDSLPQGFDAPVGEGGALLSGGQAQRLALARAFLRDAPFLVLDEPTAHLDVAQEHLLQETTRSLCRGRTVVVIAHRLSTVAQVDRVAVLDAGRVHESGVPAALLAQGGAYARLLSAYAGGRL